MLLTLAAIFALSATAGILLKKRLILIPLRPSDMNNSFPHKIQFGFSLTFH